MKRRDRIPNLGGARAVVLHRRHADGAAVLRQLAAIGLSAEEAWPDLPVDVLLADFVFFDADMTCDAQLPWTPGEAPMPLVALIGSEAPGRVEWALSQRADAHLVKPLGNSGIYSALLIARQTFEERRALTREIDSLRAQVAERRTVVQAVVRLTEAGRSEAEAFAILRQMAMDARTSIEAAASAYLQALQDGGADGRSRRS